MSARASDGGTPRPAAPRHEATDFSVVIGRTLGRVVVTVRGTLDAAAARPLEWLLRDLVENQGNRSVSIDLRHAPCPDPLVSDVLGAVAASAEQRGGSLSVLEPSQEPDAGEGVSLGLRPLERRVLRLVRSGLDPNEIARRFRRSPEWVAQVRSLAALGSGRPSSGRNERLRPLERRVLRWRASGVSHESLAVRFRRSAAHLARIEELAHYKLHASGGMPCTG